jgi:predicted amidohydrolase YtcJ
MQRADLPADYSYHPEECVSVRTAINAYTTGAAWSDFTEKELGRIAPGYWADLVFVDKDITAIPPEEIHTAKVIRTMLAGKTVYTI